MSIEKPIPQEYAPEGSTNYYTNQLHQQRHAYNAQGKLLYLPANGLIIVPFEERRDGHWAVVVVANYGRQTTREAYPVGGYNLDIGSDEIETALAVEQTWYVPYNDPNNPHYIRPKR